MENGLIKTLDMGLFGNLGKSREEQKREVFEKLSQYDSVLLSEHLVSIKNKIQLMLDSKTSNLKRKAFSDEEKELLETLFQSFTCLSKTEFVELLIQRNVDSNITYDLYSMLQSSFEVIKRNVWTTGLIAPFDYFC